jgi:hypothetical protein
MQKVDILPCLISSALPLGYVYRAHSLRVAIKLSTTVVRLSDIIMK